MDEYQRAKATIKCGKSCVEYGVTAEVLKYVPVDEMVLHTRLASCRSCAAQSGVCTKTDNYQGISLTSPVAKTAKRMILNRLRPILDPLQRNSRKGFHLD